MFWPKLSHKEIEELVFKGLDENLNYRKNAILGIPGTYLDSEQFYENHPILEHAPYLRTLVRNPNHIGCHTLNKDKSEEIFRGTQRIEIDLLETIATELLRAAPDQTDGYIAPGGTEANLQAIWIYRNYYQREKGASLDEIALFFSEDSHYSMHKGANLMSVKPYEIPVAFENRKIDPTAFEKLLLSAKEEGKKYFILVANMSTTMFGSVDDVDQMVEITDGLGLETKVHVDGAFGGFIYPFIAKNNRLDFSNPRITSVALDAHKMLQAPYGTGIFMVRKNWMKQAATLEASYVPGADYTICGSRSGANAIAIFMILFIHGSEGWKKKMKNLVDRTSGLCADLDDLGIQYFRNPEMNIVTIKSNEVSDQLAKKYRLVADTYQGEHTWFKIVVMEHVEQDVLDVFIQELKKERLAHEQG